MWPCGWRVLLRIGLTDFLHLPSMPTADSMDVTTVSSPTTEIMPAGQAAASEGPAAADTPTSVPSQTQAPAPVEVASPTNPWAADIPDAACIPADLPQTGRVVEVLDGDTMKVLLDSDGRVYSVRYLGVDAPALQDGSAGLEALARNSQLVYRKQAVMVRDITDLDVSGTLLRYVLAEGVFVIHAIIHDGLAQVGMEPPDKACLQTLLEAERQARIEARGLWSGGMTPAVTP